MTSAASGVDAPSGARWYNVEPGPFLECAAQGTFGGWRPGDASGRELVPGKVAVAGPDDSLSFVDPREIDEAIVELPEIGWEQFADFLWAGQSCLYARLTGDFSTSRCGLVHR